MSGVNVDTVVSTNPPPPGISRRVTVQVKVAVRKPMTWRDDEPAWHSEEVDSSFPPPALRRETSQRPIFREKAQVEPFSTGQEDVDKTGKTTFDVAPEMESRIEPRHRYQKLVKTPDPVATSVSARPPTSVHSSDSTPLPAPVREPQTKE
ncbi:unnamed protein product, partial [Protopolystoma xenopodis]